VVLSKKLPSQIRDGSSGSRGTTLLPIHWTGARSKTAVAYLRALVTESGSVSPTLRLAHFSSRLREDFRSGSLTCLSLTTGSLTVPWTYSFPSTLILHRQVRLVIWLCHKSEPGSTYQGAASS